MNIITISRGSFGGGVRLAERLGAALRYRCLSREAVAEKAVAPGVSQEQLLDALSKPPGFLERFRHERYQFIALFQAALAEEVKGGKVVYHCNAGHLMLQGVSPLLKVRVVAPLGKRVAMVRERLKMSASEAEAYIRKVDADRSKWTRFLYGVDWEDSALYDVVVNLGVMDVPEACDIVAAAARQECFALAGDWQTQLEDLAIGCRVRATLAINPATSHLEFEVISRQGRVSILGKVTTVDELEEVKRVARGVSGVVALDWDEVSLPMQA
jgi:Cytidylate kinase-like family/BON domain